MPISFIASASWYGSWFDFESIYVSIL